MKKTLTTLLLIISGLAFASSREEMKQDILDIIDRGETAKIECLTDSKEAFIEIDRTGPAIFTKINLYAKDGFVLTDRTRLRGSYADPDGRLFFDSYFTFGHNRGSEFASANLIFEHETGTALVIEQWYQGPRHIFGNCQLLK